MVKAKDLLDFLCNRLSVKFFSGVPCAGLKNLYVVMDSKIMHYVPAANEQIACGVVNGSQIAGNKSALILEPYVIDNMDFSFNIDNKLQLLIITSGCVKLKNSKNLTVLNLVDTIEKDLSKLLKQKDNAKVITIICIKEGVLI